MYSIRPEHQSYLERYHSRQTPHGSRTLMLHLMGCAEILSSWEESEAVVVAGLFHSVYGTESFQKVTIPIGLREQVRGVIGGEAEALVYCFGAMEKRSLRQNSEEEQDFKVADRFTGNNLILDREMWTQLCSVITANALEQLPEIPSQHRLPYFVRYEWMKRFMLEAARGAFDEAWEREKARAAP